MLALFQDIGPPEIIIILLLALLLFGAKRLPEIGRGLGKGLREFRSGVKGMTDEVKSGMDADAKPQAVPRADTTPRKDAAD